LAKYWNGPVSEFATLQPVVISLCLMGLLSRYWNGNKFGETGDYGTWRTKQELGASLPNGKVYEGGNYLGHNIAAIAVDGVGRVIDYEFNHNNVFDSSVEHAESRLVRRLFALSQVYDNWETAAANVTGGARGAARPMSLARYAKPPVALTAEPAVVRGYSTLLSAVTIYTSLESCAQCSGIMTLASVENIVYLQWDQGEFLVGNLMYNATHSASEGFTSPRPISGDEFGLSYYDQLNDGNDEFTANVTSNPFYRDGTYTSSTPSVTSYLCTDGAMEIYQSGSAEFLGLEGTLQYPEWAPPVDGALTNAQALSRAHAFLSYASAIGNRGTPHRI
jgi:tRNA(Arg) A34 adenosine deaminase TadA